MDDMLLHCHAVVRDARQPLLVGDLPFKSYEQSSAQAVGNATRLLKEGNMDAVKLEGGYGSRVAAAKAIVEDGIVVMGHVGLTLRAISAPGGFCPKGQTSSSALVPPVKIFYPILAKSPFFGEWLIDVHENMKVLDNAIALQEFGHFAIFLECLPSPLPQP
ncbi:hypothetical protein L7F22_062151 [Adiantum nelumboides]|nr:hypothetical protein [Adiantum nelumboides]